MKKSYLIFQQVGVLSKKWITSDGSCVLLVVFLLSSHVSLAQNDRGIALHDVEGIIASLQSKTPLSRQITGTYPPSYILDSISEGIHHVQGVARLTNGNYVFCHDSKDAATTGIMAFSRPGQDAVFRTFNNGDTLRHPSAMQASGNIVVVPSNEGGNSIHFFDGSSPNNPKELTHLSFTPRYIVGMLNRVMLANCAGLVYHEADQCHYVAVGSPNDEGIDGVSLYKSNGRDLVDPLCAFSHYSSFDGFVSQGGLSLLYDVSGKLYMAALYRSGSGVERVTLTELIMSGSSVSTIRQPTRNLSSSTPSPVGPEPGFRWGGTIVPTSSNSVDVVGVSKFLYLNATPGDYAEIKVWSGRSDIENCVTSKIKIPDENLFIGGDVGQLTTGANGHEWEFNKNSDGTYTVRLVGVVGNFYLRAPQNPYAAGGNKIQASQTNDDRSRWYIEPWIDGTVRMYPKHKYLSGLVNRPIRVGAGNSLILAENLDVVGLESQLFELSPTYPQITPVCKDLTVTLGSNNGLTLEPEDFVNFIVPETSCDVSYHVSKRNFSCADAGRTQTVTLTASAFETSATCSSEVTVLEQLPTLNCPSSPIIRVADANTCSYTIVGQALEPSITYGCSYSLINDYNGSASLKGQSFPLGTTTVTWTITNGDGVSATCTVDIEVIENEAPPVSCKPATVYLGADGQATINPEMVYDENSAADNCGTINLESVEPSVVSCSNIGEIEVTLTINDGNGNIATCTTVVTVVDSLPPLNVQCDQLTASLDEAGNVTVPAYLYNGQGTENCQIAGASISKFQFTCADIGVNQVIFSLIDASGNAGTCETTVTILGSSNLTPNVTDLPDAIGACAVALVPPTATDDCDGSTIMASTSDPMTYSTQGTYIVNWMYDNGSGNTIVQAQRVIVEDQVGPVPDVANLPVAIGQCEVNVTAPTATDNCSGSVSASTTDPLVYTEQGTYVVNWDYMDGNGNSTSQTQTIIVADISPPTVACQAYDLQLDASGNGTIVVADIENGITDNCTSTENLSYSLSQTNFDCSHVGENWISLRVDDNNGNTSTCTALVIVFGVDADGDGFSLCEGDTDDDDPTVFSWSRGIM